MLLALQNNSMLQYGGGPALRRYRRDIDAEVVKAYREIVVEEEEAPTAPEIAQVVDASIGAVRAAMRRRREALLAIDAALAADDEDEAAIMMLLH